MRPCLSLTPLLSVCLLLAFATTFLSTISASPTVCSSLDTACLVLPAQEVEDLHLLTNAQRFARGLGPKSPESVKRRSGSLTIPRNNYGGGGSHPSPLPPTKKHLKGTIQVWDKKARKLLGYVSSEDEGGRYEYTGNQVQALRVGFDLESKALEGKGVEVRVEKSDYPFFGLASPTGKKELASFGSAYLVSVNSSPIGSLAEPVGNGYSKNLPSESAVWTIDLLSKDVVPVWTNPDKSYLILSLNVDKDGKLSAVNVPLFGGSGKDGLDLVQFKFIVN